MTCRVSLSCKNIIYILYATCMQFLSCVSLFSFVSLYLFVSWLGPVPQGCSGVRGCWGVPDEKDGLEDGRGPREESWGHRGANHYRLQGRSQRSEATKNSTNSLERQLESATTCAFHRENSEGKVILDEAQVMWKKTANRDLLPEL